MNKLWTDKAWDDYLYWQMSDKKTLKKINELLKDIERNGPLKYTDNKALRTKAECFPIESLNVYKV